LLYVPYYDESHLDVLDTATGARVARVAAAPCPHWVAVTQNGRFAYTTNHFSDLVTLLDLKRPRVVTTIRVGHGPHSLELSPDGTRIAVVDYGGGDLELIDTATNKVVAAVPRIGSGPQDVTYAPDGRHIYTANVNDGTVTVVDAQSGAITARLRTGASPTSVSVTPDGRRAFVTNFDDGTVRLLETADG
jgi:serine/threonine-protein kinase